MKFTIDEPETEYRSVFIIRAEFTKFDGFETVDWEFKTTIDMEPVVTFLDALLSKDSSSGLRLSHDVPWKTLPCAWVVDAAQQTIPTPVIEWPEDGEGYADLDTYAIYWYDEKGYEHNVTVDP